MRRIASVIVDFVELINVGFPVSSVRSVPLAVIWLYQVERQARLSDCGRHFLEHVFGKDWTNNESKEYNQHNEV